MVAQFHHAVPILVVPFLIASSQAAIAQIIPDNTLGPENTRVTEDIEVRGAIADLIEGGAIRDKNLFHSFLDFNIESGQRVYFTNPDAITHIFSRITGNNPSNIFGTLGVDGPASLFLLNPNGIVFGETAQLDIEGSFMASTAKQFTFADGSEFSAIAPTDSSLLTVSVPLGLQYNDTPVGNVVNDGNLQIGAVQELTIFGDTVVHRGQLSTSGGTVNLFGNQVALMDAARVDVSSSTGGGDVFIGGAFQGQPTLPTAQTTYVEPGVTINASATDAGNGGQIIVWSNDATSFAGSVIARGGNIWGN